MVLAQRQFFAPGAVAHDRLQELLEWREFGRETVVTSTLGVPTWRNEYWTSRQRQAHALHEVSYRACFKPQLPAFFVERLTQPGDVVYDPFMGRGTTLVEAALRGRVPAGCDVNPLCALLVAPRLCTPPLAAVQARLAEIDFSRAEPLPEELLVFYHRSTLTQLVALRAWLLERERAGPLDAADRWIRMVAVNRLTGHSPGFFSVYTLPPNQAVGLAAQRKINERRQQTPPPRDVPALIAKKSAQLLGDGGLDAPATLLTRSSDATPELADGSVGLVVTSPPFLDVVQYAADNWLRCWFCGIDAQAVPITMLRRAEDWQAHMAATFRELRRVLRDGGWIAFEVGEVRGGTLRLEELVIPAARAAGLDPVLVLVNEQSFTKTANCWGVANNAKGTNTNRVVLLRK